MIRLLFIITAVCSITYSQPKLIYSTLSDTLAQNNITKAFADSVFKMVASHGDLIEFEDCNICKSRAHIICRVIENHFTGVTTGKAWLFADCKRKSQQEKYRTKQNVYLQNTGVCKLWGYHVAPIIISPGDTFVIDPATQKSAVKLSEWAYKLIPNNGEAYMIVKNKRYFIFPDGTGDLFEDEKSVWEEEKELLSDDEFSRSIDEVVRASLGLIEPWKMNERVEALKKLINPGR